MAKKTEAASTAASPAQDAAKEGSGGGDKAAPATFTYRAIALVTLHPSIGDVYLTKPQLERLSDRQCLTKGEAEGSHRITEPVSFKRHETITIGSKAPKPLWHLLEGGGGGNEPKLVKA